GLSRCHHPALRPSPTRRSSDLAYAFDLQPNENRSVYVTVTCDRTVAESKPLPFRRGLRAAFQKRQAASRGMTTIITSSEIFNERSEELTSELQSRENLVCRLLL